MSAGNVPPHSNPSHSDAARIPSPPPDGPNNEGWEVVPLSSIPLAPPPEPEAARTSTSPPAQTAKVDGKSVLTALKQRNQALASRIRQLEEDLERSQQALQQEVERSQRQTAEEKVATAQNHSVAQLLSDLDEANAGLQRQSILAETLSAQLSTIQARNEQLEQECTQLRQQHAEKAQSLQTTQEICADLRSRLQRQQRYTLQFKAALEKALEATTAHSTAATAIAASPPPTTTDPFVSPSILPSEALVMPRSERIQPWSASGSSMPADPQLLSLMRAKPIEANSQAPADATTQALSAGSPTAAPDSENPETTTPAVASEAESQLWQDVERVINNAAAAETSGVPTESESATAATAAFTEPIPWGAPVAKPPAPGDVANDESDMASAAAIAPSEKQLSIDVPSPSVPAATEVAAETPSESATREPASISFPTSIPAMDAMTAQQKSPSPIVHPLRPKQRKRKSLSAVELPSFPPLPKVSQPQAEPQQSAP